MRKFHPYYPMSKTTKPLYAQEIHGLQMNSFESKVILEDATQEYNLNFLTSTEFPEDAIVINTSNSNGCNFVVKTRIEEARNFYRVVLQNNWKKVQKTLRKFTLLDLLVL